MLDSAIEAQDFIFNKRKEDLNLNRMLALSLVKSLEIIGEAAAQTSMEFQNLHSEIPWRNIIGMRNRLIHAYFDINLDVLWATVTDDLTPLVKELEKIINMESPKGNQIY